MDVGNDLQHQRSKRGVCTAFVDTARVVLGNCCRGSR